MREQSYRKRVLSGKSGWGSAVDRRQIVPRHPILRALLELIGVMLQLGEVVEGIGAAQFGSVDQAHEQVADFGAFLCLVEERVLSMENGSL